MTSPSLARRARGALFVALRSVFRSIPMRESTRDAVRSKLLRSFPTVRPLPAQGHVAPSLERRPRVRADERCIGYVEYSEEPLPDPLPATLVAFYLPQFHTIPENDEWWGKGFTEWRNVARALPQFEGHLQPRLPGDLGFYDLRNPQVMRDQARLAKTYGLSAFCFYFYWFGARTLLEEPLRNWLADKSIDFQYCLCWANENWTRRWDGRDDEVLIAQKHSPQDDIAFIEYVADYLRDPRYLRVDGKPMLLLYRPMLLPDPKATAERWRGWCRENGVGEIHLAYVQSFERPDPRDIGFDAAVEFPPNLFDAPDITNNQLLINPAFAGKVLDWRRLRHRHDGDYPIYLGASCGWDNEPRATGRSRVLQHATPIGWERMLAATVARRPEGRGPTFINAWNEWAEGAVLEPDAAHGYAYLEATRRALLPPARVMRRPHVILHAWYPDDAVRLIRDVLDAMPECHVLVTTPPEHYARLDTSLRAAGLEASIRAHPNRGRDVLPFLREVALLRPDDVVLKLHTKRSPHLSDGEEWARQLVDDLVRGGNAARILREFETNPELGTVAPSRHLLPIAPFIGASERAIRALCARLGVDPRRLHDGSFPSGSMFWCRAGALAAFSSLTVEDFEPERGQIDGTLAHAVERTITLAADAAGYTTSSWPPDGRPQDPYPFASV
jgi:lipopolysaccharide biosynthesis protein